MAHLDSIDIRILELAQGDLNIEERPFDAWAEAIGIRVPELLDRMKRLKQQGVIREVKAVLRHASAGFRAGAMVAWAVPEEEVEEKGRAVAARKQVSHCYERPAFGEHRLFTMIHGRTEDEVMQTIEDIAESLGMREYKVYWSLRELKKTSMKYAGGSGSEE